VKILRRFETITDLGELSLLHVSDASQLKLLGLDDDVVDVKVKVL